MKKKILIVLSLIILIGIASAVWAISQAYTVVKPTADTINKNLEENFSKIVRIPELIPRPNIDFSNVVYSWEMETTEKEVIGVNFSYTPSFLKEENQIVATLQIPENGDPSIFDKVLPALISDDQSLNGARDPLKENLGPSDKAKYLKINITRDPKSLKATKIVWVYNKEMLSEETKKNYQKLNNYPQPVLKFLYSLPSFLISLAKG